MKLSLLSLVSLANFIVAHSETIKCKVVPFETKDGISGTCCVFFNNATSKFPQEEVTQLIHANKSSSGNVEKEGRRLNGTKEDAAAGHQQGEDKVVFNDGQKRPGEEAKWVEKKNVSIQTKNAFDIQSGCPQGQLKDHNGDCSEPF